MKPLNIIFAGTPDFAAQHLAALLNSHHNIIAVYTQPDKPAGRGKKLQASPVKQLAEQYQIPVYQPKSLRKEEAQAELKALNADVMVVVAYGLILPQAVLDMPRLGCLNVHGSLLPRWRGCCTYSAIYLGRGSTNWCDDYANGCRLRYWRYVTQSVLRLLMRKKLLLRFTIN